MLEEHLSVAVQQSSNSSDMLVEPHSNRQHPCLANRQHPCLANRQHSVAPYNRSDTSSSTGYQIVEYHGVTTVTHLNKSKGPPFDLTIHVQISN